MSPKENESITPPSEPEAPKPVESASPSEQAVTETTVPTSEAAAATAPPSTAGSIVLQWLTYAFWGWLILGLIWILSVVLIDAIMGERVSDIVPYAIAATLVMFPIAFFTDRAYRKQEPIKKTGGSSVVMIIHAVLFALLGIGTLISAVFILLNLLINDTRNNDGQITAIIVTASAAVLYAAAFLRTLNPFKSRKPLAIYSIVMAAISVLLLVFAVVGPVVSSISARNDERIENNLPSIDYAVRDYIQENKELPASLNDLTINDRDAEALVSEGLVTYRTDEAKDSSGSSTTRVVTEHRYKLCADFAKAGDRDTRSSYTQNGYARYLNARVHNDGNHCFQLTESTTEMLNSRDN